MWPPPKDGMFNSNEEAIRKVVTWMVLSIFVLLAILGCGVLTIWIWRFMF